MPPHRFVQSGAVLLSLACLVHFTGDKVPEAATRHPPEMWSQFRVHKINGRLRAWCAKSFFLFARAASSNVERKLWQKLIYTNLVTGFNKLIYF